MQEKFMIVRRLYYKRNSSHQKMKEFIQQMMLGQFSSHQRKKNKWKSHNLYNSKVKMDQKPKYKNMEIHSKRNHILIF